MTNAEHADTHGAVTHDEPHGHDADEAAPLGPIDWPAWGAAALGVAAALVTAGALYLGISPG
jgi:hypothetical protein